MTADDQLHRALDTALAPIERGKRPLINVVDCSGILSTSGISRSSEPAGLPQAVTSLRESLDEIATRRRQARDSTDGTPNTKFLDVDLGDPRSADDLCPELAVQLLKCISVDATDGALRSRVTDVLANLLPWSPVSKLELQGIAGTFTQMRDAIVVVRGVEEHAVAWDGALVRAARWAADAFHACAVVFITAERRIAGSTAIRLPTERRADYVAYAAKACRDVLPSKRALHEDGFTSSLSKGLSDAFAADSEPTGFGAELIARACYPSRVALDQVVEGLRDFQSSMRQSGTTLSDPLFAQAGAEAVVPAIFCQVLRTLFPQLLHAAETESDGYLRLHRLLVSLGGRPMDPSAALSLHEEPWDTFRASASLRQICTFALSGSDTRSGTAMERALSSPRSIRCHLLDLRFPDADPAHAPWLQQMNDLDEAIDAENAELLKPKALNDALADAERAAKEQVDGLLTVVDSGPGGGPAATAAGEWQQKVMARVSLVREAQERQRLARANRDSQRQHKPATRLRELVRKWADVPHEEPKDATIDGDRTGDSFEEAARQLVLLELLSVCAADDRSLTGPARRWVTICKRLYERAYGTSKGALAIESGSGLVRTLLVGASLRDDEAPADRLRADEEMRRLRDEAEKNVEQTLMLRLNDGFADELSCRYDDAARIYKDVASCAEAAGARELAARASFNAMRSESSAECNPSWRAILWAQGAVSLQQARSTYLTSVRSGLFISYRGNEATRAFLEQLVYTLREKNGLLKLWIDYESIREQVDQFRPAMQLALDRAEHVLFLFSPFYFSSPWCMYELTTALARSALNGQKLAWVCLDGQHGSDPADRVRAFAREASNGRADWSFFSSQVDAVLRHKSVSDKVIPLKYDDRSDALDPKKLHEMIAQVADSWIHWKSTFEETIP